MANRNKFICKFQPGTSRTHHHGGDTLSTTTTLQGGGEDSEDGAFENFDDDGLEVSML